MRAQTALIALSACLSLACLTLASAFAAKSPAMEACSKQWEDMKSAGKTEGQTWPSFWSQCSKDFAAKNPDAASAKATDTGTETPAAKPAKSKRVASKSPNEDDSPSSAQQKKECDAKWDANKQKTGAHGWHDYFQFMSSCM